MVRLEGGELLRSIVGHERRGYEGVFETRGRSSGLGAREPACFSNQRKIAQTYDTTEGVLHDHCASSMWLSFLCMNMCDPGGGRESPLINVTASKDCLICPAQPSSPLHSQGWP